MTSGSQSSVHVSVPGKVMLAGEYAVLAGGSALAHCIDRVLEVKVSGADGSGKVEVNSDLWDEPKAIYAGDLTSFEALEEPLLDIISRSAREFDYLPSSVSVKSELDVRHGVGSSSALRLGVALAMSRLAGFNDPTTAVTVAHSAQKTGQSLASGYDLVTQFKGGMVRFFPKTPGFLSSADVASAVKLNVDAEFRSHVRFFVGGKGAPTGPVASATAQWLDQKRLWKQCIEIQADLVDALSQWSKMPASDSALRSVCEATGIARQLFSGAPNQPAWFLELTEGLTNLDKAYSVKTTGAGGEDALVVFGDLDSAEELMDRLINAGWFEAPFRLAADAARWELQ